MQRSSFGHRMQLSMRRARAWRPTGADLRDLIRSTVTSFVALWVALWVMPDLHPGGFWSVLALVAIVAAVGTLLRPPLVGLAVLLGPVGLLVVGLLSQAIILYIALLAAPGDGSASFLDVFVASLIAAAIAAIINWLLDAGTADAYLAQMLRRAVRTAHRHDGISGPGLVIVQIDGLGESVLRQAITAGTMPQLRTWLRSGSHRLSSWHTALPSTTPAGQAALLHGNDHEIPLFRWYEKDAGKLMVANRPADAAVIETRLSTGRGLLADRGVSVSNLFSGDAPLSLLTMSDAHLPSKKMHGLAAFATSPGGLLRSVMQFIAEMIKELQQGRRQTRRDVQPRVPRRGWYVVLRAVTNVLLRDFNVTIVVEQMARGASVIYVDFVDYDEIAHHAGPSRAESMRTLDGLDRVLMLLAQVSAEVGRDYEIVVLSDHGQAQGATFEQQCGQTLHEVVDGLVGAAPADGSPGARADADAAPAEPWGAANVLLTGAARKPTITGNATRMLLRGAADDSAQRGPEVALGPSRPASGDEQRALAKTADAGDAADAGEQPPSPVVAAGGSLAHVYLPEFPGRATWEQIEARHPRLIRGLADHPQIGAVLLRSADGLLVVGAHGWRRLAVPGETSAPPDVLDPADPADPANGEGDDPLAVYGALAAADLRQLDTRAHLGDLVLVGSFDPSTGEVTAFEELVGSHGGLGGGQTDAVLVHPASWSEPAPLRAVPLSGVEVHRILVGRLEQMGLREDHTAGEVVPEARPMGVT